MDQTIISQYFVTRKSSISDRPTKKRKVEVTNVEKNKCKLSAHSKGSAKPNASNKRVKKNVNKIIKRDKSISFCDIFNAKPIEESSLFNGDVDRRVQRLTPKDNDNEKKHLQVEPEHAFTDVKTAVSASRPVGNVEDIDEIKKLPREKDTTESILLTPTKLRCKRSNIALNHAINDQAKAIIYSRGSSILKAGWEKSKVRSPSKVSEVLDSLSPRKEIRSLTIVNPKSGNEFQTKSPVKLSEILNTLSPQKNDNVDETVCSATSNRRNRLRSKFSHLLNKDEGSKVSSQNASVIHSHVVKKKLDFQVDDSGPSEKAHERFKHLSQKIAPTGFALPQKYKTLFEMFRCVDSVLYLLNQRSETCSFERLKKSVQSMCGRDFSLDHLAAMKTVYPNAFVFRQEKGLPISNSTSNCYQLTIEANFKESLTSNSSKLSPNVLITRKLRFEKYLLEIVKEHHQKFLRKLNMNILDSELHRWHPHFKVNDVPDIDLSSLPQPPIIKGFSTAADMIMRNKGGLAPKVQNALSIAADKTAQVEANTKANSKSNKNDDTKDSNSLVESSGINAPTSSILKGVSQSILQRIRQKEQKRMHLAMTRDPKKEQRLSNMARLPEICRILKSYFTAEKKVAIGLEDCVQKLTESYGSSLHSAKLEEHVKLLGDLVPEWLKIVVVRKYPFVKLVKGYDINKVLSSLEDLRAKELAT